MATSRARTGRPRVLEAITALGTFTIPDLCEAAGLEDPREAYYQLRELRKRGFLEHERLPAVGRHRPPTLYRLTSDPDKRRDFANEVAKYRPPTRLTPNAGLAKAALTEALRVLEDADTTLQRVDTDRHGASVEQFERLEKALENAHTDLQTVQRIGVDGESSSVGAALERWQVLDKRLKAVKGAVEHRRATQAQMAELVRAAAEIVGRTAVHASGRAAIQALSNELQLPRNVSRAAFEVLLDELRANQGMPFVPLLRLACRTQDRDLCFDLFRISSVQSPWWTFNRENARYLLSRDLDTKDWLAGYKSLRGRFFYRRRRIGSFGVYVCTPGTITSQVYLALTKQHRVSLVSSREFDFLGPAEPIKPTLLIDHAPVLEALECTFLRPEQSLYAYGPLANDVGRWPGAPSLRVVACLGMWGLSLGTRVKKIADMLTGGNALLTVASEESAQSQQVTEHVKGIIDAEEIEFIA